MDVLQDGLHAAELSDIRQYTPLPDSSPVRGNPPIHVHSRAVSRESYGSHTPLNMRLSTAPQSLRGNIHAYVIGTASDDDRDHNNNSIITSHLSAHMRGVSIGTTNIISGSVSDGALDDLTKLHYYADTAPAGSFRSDRMIREAEILSKQQVPMCPTTSAQIVGVEESGVCRVSNTNSNNSNINNNVSIRHGFTNLPFIYDSGNSNRRRIRAQNIWQMLSTRTTNIITFCLFVYWILYLGFGMTTTVMLTRFNDNVHKCNNHVYFFLQGFTALSWILWIIVGLWGYIFIKYEMPRLGKGLPMSQLTIVLSTLLAFTLMVGIALSFYGLFAARREDDVERVVCGNPYVVVNGISVTNLVLIGLGLLSYMVFYSIMTRRLYDSWTASKLYCSVTSQKGDVGENSDRVGRIHTGQPRAAHMNNNNNNNNVNNNPQRHAAHPM